MVSYFMKRYAMSEKGAINLKKAIISHTFVNLTKLFAPMIAFMFLFQYIGILRGIESYNFYFISLSYINYSNDDINVFSCKVGLCKTLYQCV